MSLYPAHRLFWEQDNRGLAHPVLRWRHPTCKMGALEIRVRQGRELFKTSFFGTQDPFVSITIAKKLKWKTHSQKGGGTDPNWEETAVRTSTGEASNVMTYTLTGTEEVVEIACYAERSLGKDMIGKTAIPLESLLQLANPEAAFLDTPQANSKHAAWLGGATLRKKPDSFHLAWFVLGRAGQGLTYAGQLLLEIKFAPDLRALAAPEKKGGLTAAPVFGVSLENAVKVAEANGLQGVPRPCLETIEFLRKHGLQEEGLFRQNGSGSEIAAVHKAYDTHSSVRFSSAYDAADVLKLYLRSLPEPVIPFAHYTFFLEATNKLEGSRRVQEYRVLLSSVPKANRDLLDYLTEFLCQVVTQSAANKMSAKNLAIVFAPNVLRRKAESGNTAIMDLRVTQDFVELLINHQPEIFRHDKKPGVSNIRKLNPKACPIEEVKPLISSGGGGGDGEKRGSVVSERRRSVNREMLMSEMEELRKENERLREDNRLLQDTLLRDVTIQYQDVADEPYVGPQLHLDNNWGEEDSSQVSLKY